MKKNRLQLSLLLGMIVGLWTFHPLSAAPLGGKKRINESKDAQEYIESKDPSIQFIPMTPKLLKDLQLEEAEDLDPGFPKWLLVFKEIPGDPPYYFQEKRLFQAEADRFYQISGGFKSKELTEAKKIGAPSCLFVSAKGYWPGERVTWRLTSKDEGIFREITCYPNPLAVHRKNGELLLEARLKNIREGTIYYLKICGIGKDEPFALTSVSGDEEIHQVLKGPIEGPYLPGVIGKNGGIARLTIDLENGEQYTLDLPWGVKLAEYQFGGGKPISDQ